MMRKSFDKYPTSLTHHTSWNGNQLNINPIPHTCLMIYNAIIMLPIVIALLLILPTTPTTTLTNSNCPSNFKPATYNTSLTVTNEGLAKSLYGSAISADLQVKIQNEIVGGNIYNLEKQFTSMSFLMPYILILVFFWVLFITVVCCSTFERRCPPCKSWRRNYVKDPYTLCERRVTMSFGVVLVTGILICTIIIFSSFTTLRKDVEMVKCGMYYSLDVTTNGDQTNNWGGFGQVQSQLESIAALVESTATTVNSSLFGNQWIIDGFNVVENMNLDLWTNNYQSTVYSPNPTTTNAAMTANSALPTIVPRFIGQGLGPNGTANTMITDIDSSLRTILPVVAQADATYRAGMTFVSSASTVANNTNKNLNSITQATEVLNNINVALSLFSSTYLKFMTSYVIYAMQAIFGIILLASLMLLLGMISSHIFDLFTCKKMVNGGWCLLGLFYFGVVGSMVFLMIIGGVSHVFCDYFNGVINVQSNFISYSMQSQSNALNNFFQYLDVCFFGDGNILKKFYIAQQMKTVQDLFTNTQTFLDTQTVGNTKYVDMTIVAGKLLGWMTAMNQYGSGIYVDADSGVLTEDNPYVALNNMNLLTLKYNSTGTKNVCANDLWVFDSTNCSKSASESLYTPSVDTTNGLAFPSSGSLCISLNTRISSSAPSIWTASDIAQRYLNRRSCDPSVAGNSTQAFNDIIKYAQSLTNYRDTRINLYKSLYDQLNSILVVNGVYNTNMTNFVANVNTFFSTVSALSNLVTNQINGLSVSSNCGAIADSFKFFYNMYCVNYVNRSVKIVVSCIVMMVLIVGGVIVGGIFGVRFQRIEKEVRLTKVDELQSEVFKMEESVVSEDEGQSNDQQENN